MPDQLMIEGGKGGFEGGGIAFQSGERHMLTRDAKQRQIPFVCLLFQLLKSYEWECMSKHRVNTSIVYVKRHEPSIAHKKNHCDYIFLWTDNIV